MKLFKSHVTQLKKVQSQVSLSQKMNGGTIILGNENFEKRKKAVQLIGEAIKLLNEIE